MGTVIPFPSRSTDRAPMETPAARDHTIDDDRWEARAECVDHDPRIWFNGGDVEVAKAICGMCPVRLACLEHAIEQGERFGVWGGLDAEDRRRLRRRPMRAGR